MMYNDGLYTKLVISDTGKTYMVLCDPDKKENVILPEKVNIISSQCGGTEKDIIKKDPLEVICLPKQFKIHF